MQYLKLLILAGIAVTNCNFQCGPEACYDDVELQNWSSQWVNNSGAAPQTSDGPLPKDAFGIRLKAEPFYLAQAGTDDCFSFLPRPFTSITLYTLDAFDTIPAQTDISDRFVLRYSTQSNLEYVPMNEAVNTLSSLWKVTDGAFPFDLLMVQPPSQPGDYRFSVQIRFDTLGATVNRDTLLVLPTVTLQ